MNLVQMSLTASAMILVITGLRTLFLHKLPKKMFLVLWWAALIRLLVPVSFPSGFSVYSLLPQQMLLSDVQGQEKPESINQALPYQEKRTSGEEDMDVAAEDLKPGIVPLPMGNKEYTKSLWENRINAVNGSMVWQLIWITGVFFSALFFISVYIKGSREFHSSFPVEEEKVNNWKSHHTCRRKISVRWSEKIQSPLSYGIIHPVILMPEDTDWDDGDRLAYVMEHEYVHVKRFDAVTKLILTTALCIHWFNPLVWGMYLLFNRDLEISCDEEVVRHFGEDTKAGYARTLISMEEKKAGIMSLCNGFGKVAIEERIKAIMKMKRNSAFALTAAVLLVVAVVLGFGTTAKAGTAKQREYLRSALGDFYTEKESEMLSDLWIDGYEDMTVSEYQDKMWAMTDTPEYLELIDSFSGTTWAFETNDREGEALDQYFQYYDHVFVPLTAERWEKREFSGAMVCRGSQVYNMAMPEQGNALADAAVFEYVIALHIENPEKLLVREYQDARSQAEKDMEEMLKDKSETELGNLQLMDAYLEEETKRIALERSGENLTVTISYSFLPLEHAGEMEHQDTNREKRIYPPASEADYESLLELMKPDYENMSVADFDRALLDWCDEDHERMERIGEDAMQGEYGRNLTEKEKFFVDLTFGLSREENHRLVNNMRAGEPEKEEDLRYGWINQDFYKSSDDGLAWVNCWYCFYWYIADKDKLTIGERDAKVNGFMEEVIAVLSDMDLEELLVFEAEDLLLRLEEIAKKYSNDLFKIEIEEENVSIERMDERNLVLEREYKNRN